MTTYDLSVPPPGTRLHVDTLIRGSRIRARMRWTDHARALLDLPADSWSSLLHVLLGHPHPAYRATSTGRGILFRLLVGETLPTLLSDDDLVMVVAMPAPTHGNAR